MSFHPHPYRLGLLYSLLIALLLALLAILLAERVASAQSPILPSHSASYWDAAYWPNTSLSGPPVLQREESTLDHDWGNASPDGRVPVDHFSARWLRYVDLDAGIYRFTATSDDGIRLYIDDQLTIDQWHIHAKTSYVADVSLVEGQHLLRVEYFENDGVALAQLVWQPRYKDDHDSWRGEYFNRENLVGTPELVRYDDEIDFNWGNGSPASGIDRDHFSVRWTRSVYLRAGRYRFTTATDDGVRLYIDGALVIDEWRAMSRSQFSTSRNLDRGYHKIRMEYFEWIGDASAELSWDRIDEEDEKRGTPVGNIITCVPPQPDHCAWIKVYRLDPSGNWSDLSEKGFASWAAGGFLKIDGLPVDVQSFGEAGHPYRVEQWIDGERVYSTGNFQAGEPAFLVRPYVDNYTPWQCSP